MESDLFRAIRRGTGGGVQAIRRIVAKNAQVLLETSRDGCSPLCLALRCEARLDVVQFLVEQRPQALREKDELGFLPVHHALKYSAPLAVLRCVVEPYPQALRRQSLQVPTPLNYAVMTGKSLEVVRYLVSKCPAAVRFRKVNGCLPLHSAFDHMESVRNWHDDVRVVKTILFLAEQWPESILEDDDKGRRALEVCIREATNTLRVRLIEDLLQLCPRAVRARGSDGLLPLQVAVASNAPPRLLGCLLDRWPEAIGELSPRGESILHWAALSWTRTALETVRFLVERDGRIVAARSRDGSLPLHAFASVRGPPFDILRFLARRDPRALQKKDRKGRTPLHCAVAAPHPPCFYAEGSRAEAIEILAEQRPESLHEKDRRGDLPLHTAVQHEYLRLELVDYLARNGPGAAAVTNRRGWSPLHLVAQREDLSLQAVQVLVGHSPDALAVADGVRRRLPLHFVCARGDEYLDVARYVVEQGPEAARHRDVDGWLPLHCAAAFDGASSLEVSRLLLAGHPEAASVATLDEGCLPIHLVLARYDSGNALPQVLPLVKLLVEACPACLLATNKDGLLPVLVAAANPAVSVDLVFRMLTEYPDSIPSPVGRPSKRPRLR